MLAALDPDRVYGIAWSGRTRVKKVSNARRVREAPGREEWIGVPVDLTGSGLDQATVDEARRVMQNNRRPLPVGDRFFELAHGPLTCAHCGCRMTGFGRRHAKTPSYAYCCNSPSRKGTDCPNRRQHHAAALEHAAASLFETYASSGKLMELYDAAIAERDRQNGRSDGQAACRSEGLAEQLKAVEDERLLSEVDERRKTIAAELRRAQDAAEQEREREAVRRALSGAAGYDPVHADWAEDPRRGAAVLLPERRRHARGDPPGLHQDRRPLRRGRRRDAHLGARSVANRSHIHGNELGEFDENGLMRRRDASINDYTIDESERRIV